MIYTRGVHKLNNNKCQIVKFADDFTIIIKSDTISDLVNTATNFMTKFFKELSDLNLHLNIDKCSSVLFNNSKEMFDLLDMTVNNLIVKNKKHAKILGITVDNRPNLNLNTRILKEHCSKSINI